ncbi:MAG: phosphodiester glycosidase family protein [Erysipelotrichaceae bacterium]|nr:phosphodiester glycosidase family protein [Erysipelotrichaceae bacterium]
MKQRRWLTRVLLVTDLAVLICFFTVYGPIDTFRNWYVTTALSTGSHKYLAYIFYSPDQLETIKAENQVIASGDVSDRDAIIIDTEIPESYENEYERQILEREPDQDYKVFEISGKGYSGWVTVIYDPTRLNLTVSETDRGQTVSAMADKTNALVAVNGGAYTMGKGNKSSIGGLMADGKVVCESEEIEELICLTDDGKLLLTYDTVQNLEEEGNIDWALYFVPFLIVNGQRATYTGNAGGQQPRTAIGQRKDGIILLVTIDGRGGNGSFGINFSGLTDIFERYGCYNAANLDGGGSTSLVVNGELLNSPVSFRKEGERKVYDALVFY